MKKTLLIIITIFSLTYGVKAGEGDLFLNGSVGLSFRNTASAVLAVEWENKYHNSWMVYLDGATIFKWCETDQTYFCTDAFWDYKTLGIGGAYKPALYRWKNMNLKGGLGVDLGVKEGYSFFLSVDLFFELTYSFKNKTQLFIQQKNDFCFWCKENFRNGIMVGIKIPLN